MSKKKQTYIDMGNRLLTGTVVGLEEPRFVETSAGEKLVTNFYLIVGDEDAVQLSDWSDPARELAEGEQLRVITSRVKGSIDGRVRESVARTI